MNGDGGTNCAVGVFGLDEATFVEVVLGGPISPL